SSHTSSPSTLPSPQFAGTPVLLVSGSLGFVVEGFEGSLGSVALMLEAVALLLPLLSSVVISVGATVFGSEGHPRAPAPTESRRIVLYMASMLAESARAVSRIRTRRRRAVCAPAPADSPRARTRSYPGRVRVRGVSVPRGSAGARAHRRARRRTHRLVRRH